MSVIINLENVEKIYRLGEVDVPALRGINLKIKKGEFLAIQGPSGSGKSTLLNAIGALDIPTKGVIYLDQIDIEKLEESKLAQIRGKKIGFVFQSFNLIPSLTAFENVILPMTFQGMNKETRRKRAKELLRLMGLEDRMQHLPSQLSGGEQQRVAIARALANDPEVLLADEPTGNLDSKTGEEILSFIRELHRKKKKTVIMITHDVKLARHADRIAYLKDGRVVR